MKIAFLEKIMNTNYLNQAIKRVLLLVSFMALYTGAQAAARYWVSTTTANWNSTANWSTTSGGSPGASVPTSSDDAIFNSAKVGSCNIDANANALTFTISTGYTGTITQNTSITLTVAGLYSQAAGTFTGGNSTITFGGGFTLTAGTFTSTTGTLQVAGNWTKTQAAGTFTHNSGTVYYYSTTATIDIYTTETFYNFTVNMNHAAALSVAVSDIIKTTGTLTLSDGYASYTTTAGYFEAQGNATVGTYWDGGTEPIVFTGTASQTFTLTSAETYFDGDVTINKSSGTVTMGSSFYMNSTGKILNLTAGTLNLAGYTVEVYYSATGNGTLNGPAASTTFTVAGTGWLKAYNYSQTTSTSNLTISAASSFYTYNNFTISSGTFTSNTADVYVSGTFLVSGGTFIAPSTNMYSYGNWTRTSGTFTHNSGTVTFLGSASTIDVSSTETFYNLTLNKNHAELITVAASDIVKATGTLTFVNGYASYATTAGYFEAQGNVTVGQYWDGGNEPLAFTGTAAQTFTLTSAETYFDGDVTINKSSGTVTMGSSLYMNNTGKSLNLTAGTLNLAGYTVEVYCSGSSNGTLNGPAASTTFTVAGTGNLNCYAYSQTNTSSVLTFSSTPTFYSYATYSQTSGTFTANASTVTLAGSFTLSTGIFNAPTGTMNIYGNWTRSSGTFNHDSGTVAYYGAGATLNISGVSAGTETFYNLTVNLNGGALLTVEASDIIKTIGTLTLVNGYCSYYSTAGYFEAQGNVTVGSAWDGGNEPLVFTGTRNQTFTLTSAETYFNGNVTINKTTGVVTMGSSLYLNGSSEHLYLSSGTLNLNTYTVEAYYSTTPNNYIYGPTASSTFSVTGTGSLYGYNYTHAASGTISFSTTSTFYIYATFAQSAGTFTSNTATVYVVGNFNLTGGTFNATSTNMYAYGNWTRYTAATFNHNSGTVNWLGSASTFDIAQTSAGTETFNNLTVNKDGGVTVSFAISDIAKTIGTLTLVNGAASYTTTAGAFEAQGNVTVGIYWDGGNEPLLFSGTADQNFTLTSAEIYFNGSVTINKSSGTVTMLSSLYLNGSGEHIYLTSGTLNLNTFTVEAYYSTAPNNYIYGPTGTTTTFTVSGTGWLKGCYFSQTGGASSSTLTISGASSFYTYSTFTLTTGTFTSNSATVYVVGNFLLSGGTFNAPSTNMYAYGNWSRYTAGTFNHNSGTVTWLGSTSIFDIAQGIAGTETFNNLTVNKDGGTAVSFEVLDIAKAIGTLTLVNGYASYTTTAGYFEAQGNVTVGTAWDGGNEPLVFSGTANQNFTLTSAETYFNGSVTINKSSGIVTMLSSLYLNGASEHLYLTAGTLNLNGMTVEAYYSTGPNNYIYGPAAATTFTVSGTGNLNGYNYSQTNSTSVLTISAASSFYTYAGFTISAGTFTPNTATVTISGNLLINGGTFNAPSTNMYATGNWTRSSGTFTHNSGTVTFNGGNASMDVASTETFYNLTINKNHSTYLEVAASDRLISTGTLTLVNGYASYNTTAGYFEAQGNVAVGIGWDGGNEPLVFTGTANQNFDLTGAEIYFNASVTINKSSGIVTMLSSLYLNGSGEHLYLTSGTLNLNGYTVEAYYSAAPNNYIYGPTGTSTTFTVSGTGWLKGYYFSQTTGTGTLTFSAASNFYTYGNYTLSAGTFTANTAAVYVLGTLTISGGTFNAPSTNIYAYGNWTRSSGTFTHNSGTVTMYSSATTIDVSGVSSGTETFYNLTVNKDHGTVFYIAAADLVRTTGTLTLVNGYVSPVSGTSYLEPQGNVTVGSGFDGGTAAMTFTGSGNSNFDLTSATTLFNGVITVNKTSSTVTLVSDIYMDAASQNLSVTSGTLDLNGYILSVTGSGATFIVSSGATLQMIGTESPTTPTLNSGSIVAYDGTGATYTIKNWTYPNLKIIGGSTSIFSLPATLTGITTLTITSGILYLNAFSITATTLVNDATLRLIGSETMTITTMDVNSGTVEYVGANSATTYTIKDFGTTDYYNLLIYDANATKATFQLGGAIVIAGTLTITGGTYSANGQTSAVTGVTTVNGGTYTASTATQTLTGGLTVSSGTFTGSTGIVDINGTLTLSGGTYTAPSTTTYVYGNWTQSGTFNCGTGSIVFDGASNQTITASSAFNNLSITNSSGATLASAITVGGTLTLTTGKISLGSYNLNMSSGAALSGGSSSSFIYTGGTGALKYLSCAASTSKTFPVGHTNSAAGYTPLVITFNSGHTTDDFSVVAYDVICNDGTRTGTAYTSTVVKTTWNISETTSGGSNINVQFQWNGTDEGASFNRASCRMAHHNGSTWDNIGSLGSASGANPYTFTYTGYTGTFSPFGMGGSGGPLPVTFLYLNVKKEGEFGQLNWATGTEINNDYFNIEKSLDGKKFFTIGKVFGAGNSQQILRYAFTDSNLIQGTNYYRLKQVDYDGKFEYTPIQFINNSVGRLDLNTFQLSPVPAKDVLNVEYRSPEEGDNSIKVINQMGNPLITQNVAVTRGMNNFTIDLTDLPIGIYFLRIENPNGSFTCRRFSILK